jgi:poly(ADP-ribose) glycohydrolase
MARRSMVFILPHSPDYRCLDRFSLHPDETQQEDKHGLVPFWPILQVLLSQQILTPKAFIELLDTITTTLHGTSGAAGDYGFLKDFLTTHAHGFFDSCWPMLAHIASALPTFFPLATLPVLGPGDELRLSGGQVACLVVHQFLCTLQVPPWRDGYHDFSIWYSSGQRHPKAVEMYLTALFTYFASLPDALTTTPLSTRINLEDRLDTIVIYRVRGCESISTRIPLEETRLSPIEVICVEEHTAGPEQYVAQGPRGAMVVASNKMIGFGQSATQEEVIIGISPEACPAVLVTLPLEDDETLSIDGSRAMLTVTGERRDIRWKEYEPAIRDLPSGKLLLMDALEMDLADTTKGLADLDEGNVDREIRKAATAFTSPDHDIIWTGLWGCGAFGGNPAVKMVILWIAASVAGVRLKILCGGIQQNFGRQFEVFTHIASARLRHAGELRSVLANVPSEAQRHDLLDWFINSLQR